MKMTIELPDQLFRDAKVEAAKRHTTLKLLLTRALERELYPHNPEAERAYNVYEDGLPYFPAQNPVTTNQVNQLLDEDAESGN